MKKRTKQWLLDAAAIGAGTALVALGLAMFTIPNDIAPGGVSGLATALTHVTGGFMTVGAWSLLLNVPLAAVAWWKLGFRPLCKTLAATVLLSVFIDLLSLVVPPYTNNPLLAAGFGGALMGVGMGVLFARGISTGGTDLLTLLLNRVFPNLSLSTLLLCIDTLVVVFAVIVFGNIEIALYSFVTIFVASKAIDGIMQGVDHTKVLYVVTEQSEALLGKLAMEMGLGVTALPARGGYTGRDKQMLMVVTHRSDFAKTLGLIKSIDPAAFLIVMNATEVHGEGFKEIK